MNSDIISRPTKKVNEARARMDRRTDRRLRRVADDLREQRRAQVDRVLNDILRGYFSLGIMQKAISDD